MKNKSLIVGLSVIITLLSTYFLSFTWISKGVQEDATVFATNKDGKLNEYKKQSYLDSVWKEPVFNFLGIDYTYQQIKEQELHLGLDLQGGMHVTLEVSPVEIVKALSSNPNDPKLLKSLALARNMQKTSQSKFIDLFDKAFQETNPGVNLATVFTSTITNGRIDFKTSNADVLKVIDLELENAIERSFNILRTRIDKFGVVQPNIQRLRGTNRIQLELPGIENPDRVRRLLQGSANLEFYTVWEPNELSPFVIKLNDYLLKKEKAGVNLNYLTSISGGKSSTIQDTTNAETLTAAPLSALDSAAKANADTSALAKSIVKDSATAKKDTTKAQQNGQSELFGKLFIQTYSGLGAKLKDTAKVNRLLAADEIKGMFPSNMKFMWASKSDSKSEAILDLYAIRKSRDGKAPLSGKVVTEARQELEQGGAAVSMQMNAEGARKWKKLTADNIGKKIAIVMDDNVLSAPTVNGEIPNGNSSITGNFSIEEAKDLANKLKSGRMPAPVTIVEEAVVGPSLGKEAINQGLMSSVLGTLAVIVFMVMYYSKGGMVANLALLVNVFFIMGIMVQLGAVLTLPGIAGIVLTIGMSVDANVLIFERVREELLLGKTVSEAIEQGYSKAFSSIFDSNVTTLLTGIILALLGTGPVQGFAVTLIIGILTSFFTAVYISRYIIEWMLKGKENAVDAMSFSTPFSKGLFKNLNYNIIGNRKKAYMFSAIVIIAGFGAIIANGGLALGVDFKGGRSFVVEFTGKAVASDVRLDVMKAFENNGTEVKTYGSDTKLKITTVYLTDDESEEADKKVLAALNTGLTKYSSLKPTVLSSSKVGAAIADDIKDKSYWAIFWSLVAIFLYILLRFRKFQFSVGAIIALLHDVLCAIAVMGLVAAFGLVYEMDQIVIAALLTLVGYSINDTVVIFDRLREYINESPDADLATVMNKALNDTFSRTIITATTVFLVLIVLYVFGGEILSGFSFCLLVGLFFGSYSSIYIAAPIVLDLWKKNKKADNVA